MSKSIPGWPDPSPAGRQNCKPWSERPQSARADYKSWNNDWSSSILGFRCKKFKQNFDLINSRCWSAKLYLDLFNPKFWLSGCTFDHLSSFLPWRTASVIFTQEDQIASRILQFLIHQKLQDSFFLDFYTCYEASIASPCVVLWEIKRKRAFPKALRPALIRVRGIYCNNVVWTPLLLFCDKRVNCLFILFIFLLYLANIFCNDFVGYCISW